MTPLTPEQEAAVEEAAARLIPLFAWPQASLPTALPILRSLVQRVTEPLLYTSDKQTVAWKERALKAEARVTLLEGLLRESRREVHAFRDARCESCDLDEPQTEDEAKWCDCGTPTCREQQAIRLELLSRIDAALGEGRGE